MAITTPITGLTTVKVGSTSQLANSTPSGIWSSSDTAIAIVDSVTGVVTSLSIGECYIVYTVDPDSTSILFTVTAVASLTNGFNFNSVYGNLVNRVLWQSQGIISESQRYFEDFHPLNDTAIMDAIRPQNGQTLTQYLANKQRAVIMECLNAIFNAPQILDKSKLCFFRSDVMLYPQPVPNQNQFVGIKMFMSKGDYSVKYNTLELFFTEDVTFTMYLYNDMTLPPVYSKVVTAQAQQQVIVDLQEDVIQAYLTSNTKGGIRYFGYYQEDLGTAQAVYYPINQEQYSQVKLWSYSAPVFIDIQGNRNFVRNNIGSNNLSYGLNIEVSTFVDATNNINQNKHLWDELIGLKMAERNVRDIIFDYRSNKVQRVIGAKTELSQLYAELNGFKADEGIPYIMGLKDQINRELKRVKGSFQNYLTSLVGVSA